MKTLRILTFAVTSIAALVCVWILSPAVQGLAQEDGQKAVQPATKSDAETSQTQTPPQQPAPKVELRRNEASGAAALITMEQARDKLIGYKSVKSDIVEVVTIGNRKLRLSGKYLQGTDLQLRFEYEVTVGATKGTLLEVCDGQILWTYYEIGKQKRVARRSVRQILDGAGGGPDNLLIAEIGLGGLPGLLASIQRAIVFDKQWEQDVDDRTFVVVEGAWSPQFRTKFLGPQSSENDPLPIFVPDRVRIYYDQTHLFPRRVLYLKQDPQTQVDNPMVKLDFVNVQWDFEVDPMAFNYTPPENVPREDTTEHYLKQFIDAKKKADEESSGPSKR